MGLETVALSRADDPNDQRNVDAIRMASDGSFALDLHVYADDGSLAGVQLVAEELGTSALKLGFVSEGEAATRLRGQRSGALPGGRALLRLRASRGDTSYARHVLVVTQDFTG